METLFLTIINMSITSTYILVCVLLLRLPLRRAPRWLAYTLWLPLMIRLVSPVSFSSSFALLGRLISTPAGPVGIQYIPPDIGQHTQPRIDIGIHGINQIINPVLPAEAVPAGVNPLQIMISICSWVWLAGFLIMLACGVISYFRLKRKIGTAIKISEQIYESDEISTPFVCGFFKPAIYLPVGLNARDQEYVVQHERAHLERFDHLVKPLAFVVLSIHWFNPLIWLAFRMLGRDMEMCCDERVIRYLGRAEKADYGTALVRLAAKRPLMAGSPLAFGENSVKGRIKNILNVKRPAFWITIVLVILLVLAGIALLSNPLTNNQKNLAELNRFTAAVMQRHNDIVDMTADYKDNNPDFITDWIRVLVYGEAPYEPIIVELAADRPVEELVNERLSIINNPLVDFFRPVHLFVKGNLVVQYVGTDETILKSLTEILGPEWPRTVPYTANPVFASVSTISAIPLTNREITNESELYIIQQIITSCNNSQDTWSGKPVDEIPDKTQILVRQTLDSDYLQYTLVFDDTGPAFIISDQTGHYCQLDVAHQAAFLEIIRSGFYENPVMTVNSGDKEIKAIGHWVYSHNKITKVSADGRYLTAHNIKSYLHWLPIDFEQGVKEGTQAFAVYINGREQFGDFYLYDEQMNRIDIFAASGLAPQQYMLNSLEPGLYIVEMRINTSTLIYENGYQYFFGVIIGE